MSRVHLLHMIWIFRHTPCLADLPDTQETQLDGRSQLCVLAGLRRTCLYWAASIGYHCGALWWLFLHDLALVVETNFISIIINVFYQLKKTNKLLQASLLSTAGILVTFKNVAGLHSSKLKEAYSVLHISAEHYKCCFA